MSSVLKIGQTCLTAEETYDLLTPGPCAKPAPRPLSLRSNFSWTLAGNVVYAGCQWGMLVVLAKFGSPEKVGQFALGLAVTAPIIMFSNLQLRAIQATDARREYRFGHYLALRLATMALALFVIVGIACTYRLESALVILAVGLSKAFESLSDVVYGLLQFHERMDRIALSMMIKGPLSLAALSATTGWRST
jgi:O-antigen/teichoic acid export membrane protein